MRQRILAGIILSLMAATTSAALLGRVPLTPGGTDYQAYFDDVLNITWQANANLAESQTFGLTRINANYVAPGEVGPTGKMQWGTANSWIAGMNSAGYLGVSDWRLPSADVNGDTIVSADTDCYLSESACRDNEMGYHSWYNGIHQAPYCLTGPPYCMAGPFTNVRFDYYWSGTEYAPNTSRAWGYYFPSHESITELKDLNLGLYAWAVRPGDIGVVPVPAAVWLLGSALGVLGVMRRRTAG